MRGVFFNTRNGFISKEYVSTIVAGIDQTSQCFVTDLNEQIEDTASDEAGLD